MQSRAGNALDVDVEGNAYVTGATQSNNFPTTANAFDTTFEPVAVNDSYPKDAFVTKLNPAGSEVVFSSYLGGTLTGDEGHGIAVDAEGRAHITGFTDSRTFRSRPTPLTPPAVRMASATPPRPGRARMRS